MWRITPPVDDEPAPEPTAPVEPTPRRSKRYGAGSTLPVRHGYSMADLDRLARLTITFHRDWYSGGDRNDQYEAAWHGIALHLCAVKHAPSEQDLLDSGRRALHDDSQRHQQMHGTRRGGTNTGVNFLRYWEWHSAPAHSPEEVVVDRLALDQIMGALKDQHAQALVTLAAFVTPAKLSGDVKATAAALEISYAAANTRLMRARAHVRELWYAPDEAPPMHRAPVSIPAEAWERLREKCVHGHEMTPENTQWEKPGPGRLPIGHCRECDRVRGQRRRAAARAGVAA